ncbi:MAG: hypothetical protein JXA71_14170 [Chitinispirillaceae bacterium]|nr:hypothetical protein [Chitinispirillaceae bacterium]
MRTTGVFAVLLGCGLFWQGYGQETEVRYLSGKGVDDAVDWEFYCTAGMNNGRWTTIPVPSNWELHGFGAYNYGHDQNKASEEGRYRHSFTVPSTWNGKRVFIVFEGSMTDTRVSINGNSAGPVHQGAFYRFKYEITQHLNFSGSNLLEVTVAKMSSNSSINSAERQADYWVFGGIFRPVYLEAFPQRLIERIAVNARADGTLSADVYLDNISGGEQVTGSVVDADGRTVGSQLSATVQAGAASVSLRGTFSNIDLWSAEYPHRYRLKVDLRSGGNIVHTVKEHIGFRTVEVRAGNGIYINGKKVMFRGVDRHCFWPSSGRALSPRNSREDILLAKSMNINAIRNSHYPADRHFMEYCDSLGMYMLDELAGWQVPPYDTDIGRTLVEEMVTFDVNHPCIIFWDNGNEGGWNTALDADFGKWDPQNRAVLHPWTTFSNVNTDHYESYSSVQNILNGNTIYMPTEFLHGLYDGGHGAGLEDYWNLMRSRPRSAGGFLWVFADEAVVRTDNNNRLDARGNLAPDGIVGPYHEKEGSFYAIREIWSPVQIAMDSLPGDFTGTIEVENRYDFTNFNEVLFTWRLARFAFMDADSGYDTVSQGTARTGSITPGNRGSLRLDLPGDWHDAHALLLSATDGTGRVIGEWSWMIPSASAMRESIVETESAATVSVSESASEAIMTAGNVRYTFSKTTGRLANVSVDGRACSFGNGPTLSAGSATLQSIDVSTDGNNGLFEATYSGDLESVRWRVQGNGWLSLTYRYSLSGRYDYYGVDFDYPESKVNGAVWLGKGPYRVWKNRMRGTVHNLWQRDYNDAITGQVWEYPEFKGYFADVYWARLLTDEVTIHVVMDSRGMFLRLFTPKDGVDPQTSAMVFPGKNISFLHGIPPIGTKFLAASDLGPQGQKHSLNGTFEGRMYLFFGDTPEIRVAVHDRDALRFGNNGPASSLVCRHGGMAFNLSSAGHVAVTLHTLDGKKHSVLYSGERKAGTHCCALPGRGSVAAGLYICTLSLEGAPVARRAILIP